MLKNVMRCLFVEIYDLFLKVFLMDRSTHLLASTVSI
jgi:hypothetical protein